MKDSMALTEVCQIHGDCSAKPTKVSTNVNSGWKLISYLAPVKCETVSSIEPMNYVQSS